MVLAHGVWVRYAFIVVGFLLFVLCYIKKLRKSLLASGIQEQFASRIIRVCPHPVAWAISHLGAVDNIDIAEVVVALVAFQFTAVFQPLHGISEVFIYSLVCSGKQTLAEVNTWVLAGLSIRRNLGSNSGISNATKLLVARPCFQAGTFVDICGLFDLLWMHSFGRVTAFKNHSHRPIIFFLFLESWIRKDAQNKVATKVRDKKRLRASYSTRQRRKHFESDITDGWSTLLAQANLRKVKFV